MDEIITPTVARWIASAVAGGAVWLAHKTGTAAALSPDAAAGVGVFIAGAVYSGVHRLLGNLLAHK